MELHDHPAPNRHLITLSEVSKIPLAYGCTECYWKYDPKGISEVYEAATLRSAQVLFGMHDCHKFKAPSPGTPAQRSNSRAA
jgi:hypothetical protein